MASSCLPCTGSDCFKPLFSRSRLSHSQFLDCVGNFLSNFFSSRVPDPIRNLDSLPGDNFHHLTSGCVFKPNLPLHLDIHQLKFQDFHTSSASSISDRCSHAAVSLSPLRCDADLVSSNMSAGISLVERPSQPTVCSQHTATYFSLVDSSMFSTMTAPTRVSSPSPAVFSSS